MFNKIEDLYKKKSPYNRITKRIFWVYIIIIFLLWILNINNIYIMMVITLIMSFLIIKRICEKELKTKLYINIDKKEDSGKPLNEIIIFTEKKMFKAFLKTEKKYNKETLECILNHYRTYIKPKIAGDNFLAIVAIVVSIALAFVSKEGFNINSFEKALPYLFCFIVITAIIYFSIKKFIEIKKIFKGEAGMYERLEVIFSEMYIEYKNDKNKTKNKGKSTKSRKQTFSSDKSPK